MEYWKFIIYGLIQGLTEFIPVSSTAHLKVLSHFFGIEDPGPSLSAIIQIGSVIALIWYFRNDFFNLKSNPKKLLKSFLNKKLFKSIFIGTIPIIFFGGIVTLFIPKFFEEVLRSNLSIAIFSLIISCLMYFADISKNRLINIRNHNYYNSILIGFAQAFAIIPGVSRSGVTISIALLSGWQRKDAAKYSFLLGIPAISLAAITQFFFSLENFSKFSFPPLIIGVLTTFLTSLFAIDFLIKYLPSKGMKIFVFYRIFFAILIIFNLDKF